MFQIWFVALVVAGVWITALEIWERWPPGR